MPDAGSPSDDAGTAAESQGVREVRDIVHRLSAQSTNPVTRARIRVEQEIPPARRGPGWDRHWRELEAYGESSAEWLHGPEPDWDGETKHDG